MGDNKKITNDVILTEQELKGVNGAGEPTEEKKSSNVLNLHPGYSMTRDYSGALGKAEKTMGIPSYVHKI